MSGYSFFSSVYDTLTENVNYAARADYIADLLADNGIKGGILLDLACGTGTLSIEMADKGFEVIGVDSSADMLSVAMNNAYESEKNILFLCQQMQQLDLYGTINAAICTLDSINHLTDPADVQKTFDKVSLFTEPGGIFIFDINTVYKHREVLADNTFVYDTDDVYCVWQNSLDKETDTVQIDLDIFEQLEDGVYERMQESFCERAYPLPLIKEMLYKAGFETVTVYDELSREEPKETSERLFVIARKK
ncbi:MAG: class I SAM-dependent methyltransferase [Clostridia bacterium]|nr:class I SAM-dependent methyltransferase [Clostridia bacterium]